MRRACFILAMAWSSCVGLAHAQTLNVFAAASLKETATQIAKEFEKRHPQVHVALNIAGSQQLVAQIKQGAPVDVLLSAGMDALKGLDYDKASLRIFATNRLALITPLRLTQIKSLPDLTRSSRLVIADGRVPVGDYTLKMLEKAEAKLGRAWKDKVLSNVVSKEQDVRAVLTKVELGEADAGVVYASDVKAANGKVRAVPIAEQFNVEARYPAVRFARSASLELAKDFMKFLFEADAQRVLSEHGFGHLPVHAMRIPRHSTVVMVQPVRGI